MGEARQEIPETSGWDAPADVRSGTAGHVCCCTAGHSCCSAAGDICGSTAGDICGSIACVVSCRRLCCSADVNIRVVTCGSIRCSSHDDCPAKCAADNIRSGRYIDHD